MRVSLLIPARNSAEALERTVKEAEAFFGPRLGASYELVLIPNPRPGDASDRSIEAAQEISRRYSRVRVVPHSWPPGKGAALRTGFEASRGELVFFTDADLPYDLEFFDRALERLSRGDDLVTGNRRLLSSHFHLPVELLPVAYGRHRLGLGFNRVVRWIFPVRTSDTQAGIKAMSRELARAFFGRQLCPGFFFDLELFLVARENGFRHTELPVTLHLNSEKSTVRVLRESLLAGFWLLRLALAYRTGHYSRHSMTRPRPRPRIQRRYAGASPGTRLFLAARWGLTPYSAMAAYLPARGKILDLGCGHGLLALIAAIKGSGREVLGVDHDEARVALATAASRDLPNLRFRQGGIRPFPAEGPYSAITLIDFCHYFDPETQREIARKAYESLVPGGTLLVREVEPQGGLASRWNQLYEKLATTTGFTRAEKKGLHFRGTREWEEFFRSVGFEVRSEPCSSVLFSDVLFICERPRGAPAGTAP